MARSRTSLLHVLPPLAPTARIWRLRGHRRKRSGGPGDAPVAAYPIGAKPTAGGPGHRPFAET